MNSSKDPFNHFMLTIENGRVAIDAKLANTVNNPSPYNRRRVSAAL